MSQETEAAGALRERMQTLTAEGEAAGQRAAILEIELGTARTELRGARDFEAEKRLSEKS